MHYKISDFSSHHTEIRGISAIFWTLAASSKGSNQPVFLFGRGSRVARALACPESRGRLRVLSAHPQRATDCSTASSCRVKSSGEKRVEWPARVPDWDSARQLKVRTACYVSFKRLGKKAWEHLCICGTFSSEFRLQGFKAKQSWSAAIAVDRLVGTNTRVLQDH